MAAPSAAPLSHAPRGPGATAPGPHAARDPGITALLTVLALCGFAANSLLCRVAVGARMIDPTSFAFVRFGSGAVALLVLASPSRGLRGAVRGGSWSSALALFFYAAAFSLAYQRIGAGIGALLLFGAGQLTMIAWGIFRGERPLPLEWAGLGVALLGLGWLTLPGAQAPDPAGALLMVVAGVAWGIYSLRGRASGDPLGTTCGNFARAAPLTLLLALVFAHGAQASPRGLLLATASGVLATGIGYSFWYAALYGLSAVRAALIQLAVPVLTAVGAVLLLGEAATARLVIGGAAILGGLVLTQLHRFRRT